MVDPEPRRLVWSEVRDLLELAGHETAHGLISALEAYEDDPPLPDEPVPL